MDVLYCWKWNIGLAQPSEPMSEGAARERDAKSEQYAVIIYDEQQRAERCITIVWRNSHIGVAFLDAYGRPVLRYSFQLVEPDLLFCSKIVVREWEEGQQHLNESSIIETSYYKRDGSMVEEVTDTRANQVASRTGTSTLEGHWEPVPEFGDWASIARYDRSLPVDQQPPGRPWLNNEPEAS